MVITFSHTVLVSGFGSSCSQALLATLPSQTVGSGRIRTSRPVLEEAGFRGVGRRGRRLHVHRRERRVLHEARQQHLVPGRFEVRIAGRLPPERAQACHSRSAVRDRASSTGFRSPSARHRAAGSSAGSASPCHRERARRPRIPADAASGRCQSDSVAVSSTCRPAWIFNTAFGSSVGEIGVGRRGVDRIGVQHHQHRDLTGAQCLHQVFERLGLREHRIGVEDRRCRYCRAPR